MLMTVSVTNLFIFCAPAIICGRQVATTRVKNQGQKGSSFEFSSMRKSNPKDSHVKIHNFEELKEFSFSICKN